MTGATTGRTQAGSQTLARGLHALLAVVESNGGMTVQELAGELDVHRSIAYRILQTLVNFGFVTQGDDGAYHPGALLATLADTYLPALRAAALPVMREAADELGCTISLFVAEGREAAAIALEEPTTTSHHIAFKVGMRTPIDRGAAGYALLSAGPPLDGEPEAVTLARERGYATSEGEILIGAYAIAAPVPDTYPQTCVNIITHRADQARTVEEHIVEVAQRVGRALPQIA
ncbi:helix-turn-helix domain-containing protein [Actinomadura barringtoniae]|uniref:Helix-turn-helix domain-containing protein n=1 Tax=Actinomadura barringtoniae TaxID=1427535 RepID=A0A939T500_9ACTN|nr:helix-turn-helix domain-containing protein [Actinomadura barringtoniae]MBO2453171.1 helix-turn-helix domain-containing protein [Actinomadura barringtoniae]